VNFPANNLRRAGLVLFVIGVIIFFGQRYVLSLFYIVVYPFMFPYGGYDVISQGYILIYFLVLILIISGVVLFYKGKEKSGVSYPADKNE
jgi:uncharacterized membrane protein YgdD (TMEM256/DUF423 family)